MVNGIAIYNDELSVNFELHPSEETDLVIKILALAGITIKDQGLYQIAAGVENNEYIKKKQK